MPIYAPQRKRKHDAAADGAPAAPRVADADNADKAARTVFVGNLAAATKPKRLKQLFTPCVSLIAPADDVKCVC